MGFPGSSALRNPPAEDCGFDPWRELQEGTLEKEMATHSSIHAWEMLWTENMVGYSPWGHKIVRHDLVTK